VGCDGLDAPQVAEHFDVELATQRGLGHLRQPEGDARANRRGAVDQDVDATEGRHRRVDHGLDRAHLARVGHEWLDS
jgi:hypothetical protein